jgi:hypothetical protein
MATMFIRRQLQRSLPELYTVVRLQRPLAVFAPKILI